MTTPASRVTVHCIGNAHIDPVWRWPWQEGYTETLATCRAALDRLQETDDFIFSRGQAATYAWIEEADPTLFAAIQQYVRTGRWQIVNGWWEQPDANVPCGESYVRQALYGKRYFQDRFGVDVTVGWNPDTFGHNAGLPQILAKSGFATYCFFRPGRHEMDLPGPYFWWQGRDGSRVLAIRPPAGHYCTGGGDLSQYIRDAARLAQELGYEHTVLFYGVGNHGGGPTKENIATIRSLYANPEEPRTIFSSIPEFAAALTPHAADLPTVHTDLQHHAPGCYTTHSEIKRLNREAENRLLRAERWCALANLTLGRPYHKAEFERAWKQVLFNQFHDILAGTSVPIAYDHAREQLGEAMAIAAREQNAALQALAARVDTRLDETEPPEAARGRVILLFNPSSQPRADSVTVQWGWHSGQWDVAQPQDCQLLDEASLKLPFQFIQPDIFGGGLRLHFEALVPAHGWRVYRLMPYDGHPPVPMEGLLHSDDWIESTRWRLEFDPQTGHLIRLYDKEAAVEALAGPACALRVMDDPGDTWGHDIAAWRDEVGVFGEPVFAIVEDGPTRITLRVTTRWQDSTARQEFTLYRTCPRIDVTLHLDWREKHKMLKLSVPVAVQEGTLTYDAPYSTSVREANGQEDPGQTWIDLTGTAKTAEGRDVEYGVSLLNDGKFGFDCLGNDLRMSLLRSPIYCFHDPAKIEPGREYLYMDQGAHTLRYALLPHYGSWQQGGTVQEAYALNNPLETVFQYPHDGEWEPSGALLTVTPPTVMATALKVAEDGDDLILRLFETTGQPGDTAARMEFPGTFQTTLEPHEPKTLRSVAYHQRTIEVQLKPHELKTLRCSKTGESREVNLLER
jgi:alpha-mannosidase